MCHHGRRCGKPAADCPHEQYFEGRGITMPCGCPECRMTEEFEKTIQAAIAEMKVRGIPFGYGYHS